MGACNSFQMLCRQERPNRQRNHKYYPRYNDLRLTNSITPFAANEPQEEIEPFVHVQHRFSVSPFLLNLQTPPS